MTGPKDIGIAQSGVGKSARDHAHAGFGASGESLATTRIPLGYGLRAGNSTLSPCHFGLPTMVVLVVTEPSVDPLTV